MAVLTKPDLVDKGAEDHIITLVNETAAQSELGYVLVCNRSQRDLDIPLSDRHQNEQRFFSSAPWNEVAGDRAGIVSLKHRLSTLTINASRQTFEQVRLEIIKKLATAQSRLKALGGPRDWLS